MTEKITQYSFPVKLIKGSDPTIKVQISGFAKNHARLFNEGFFARKIKLYDNNSVETVPFEWEDI